MPCKIIVEIVEIAFLGNERSADFNVDMSFSQKTVSKS